MASFPARLPARQRLRRALLLSFLLLFPLTFNYYSPVLPVMGLLEGVAAFSLLFWAAWTVAALWLGRAACGWICPLAGLQELWGSALQRRPRRSRWLAPLRWALFAAWVAVLAWAAWRGGGLRRVEPLYRTEHLISWDSLRGAFIYVGMFGLVMLVAIPLGGRAFCRHLCWWAPLNMLGDRAGRALRLPVLRLAAAEAACDGCGQCAAACPAGLPARAVAEGRASLSARLDCVSCAACADACPRRALRFTFAGRGIARTGDPGRAPRAA